MHRKYNLRYKLRNLDGINPYVMPGGDEGDRKGACIRRHMPHASRLLLHARKKRSYMTVSVAHQNEKPMP